MVLADIELAQQLKEQSKNKNKDEAGEAKEEEHPNDLHYNSLRCDLSTVDRKSKEYKVAVVSLEVSVDENR